ncbi:MAG: T9SS type A sorting domain-containing protein [Melioribacteraceae bacterium]|nr:MAG: T9SS type A sorting domain-containing protein [Melioribacteraceae bacterium]
MKILCCLLILFTIQTNSQTRIYPPLPHDRIVDIQFINEREFILISENGSIYKSYDQGNRWVHKQSISNEKFDRIKFADEHVGYILPEKSSLDEFSNLYFTLDGGESWVMHSFSIQGFLDFLPVTRGILLQSDYNGNILRLDNFFDEWDTTYQLPKFLITINYPAYDEIYYSYGAIDGFTKLPSGDIIANAYYYNALNFGIITDSVNVLFKSSDLGVTWEIIWSGLFSNIFDIQFASDSIGYFQHKIYDVYTSRDSGRNWTGLPKPENSKWITQISVASEDTVYIVSDDTIFVSTDGGNNWHNTNQRTNGFRKLKFFNGELGFNFGDSLFRSSNSGSSWENLYDFKKDDIIDLNFVSKDVGFCQGRDTFYRSNNGGYEWEVIESIQNIKNEMNLTPNSFALLSESIGFIGFSKGRLYKTVNGGDDWELVSLQPYPSEFRKLWKLNNSTILLSFAKIINAETEKHEVLNYLSTDSGSSWKTIPIDSTNGPTEFSEIVFIAPNYLFVLDRNSGLWLSEDTAKSWFHIYDHEKYFVGGLAFDFFDRNFGIIAKSFEGNLITVDGGKNWSIFSKIVNNHPSDFEILGKNSAGEFIALESGRDGVLLEYHISSSGELISQRKIETETSVELRKIETFYHNDDVHTWISGDDFILLYKIHQSEITSVGEQEIILPSSFTLHQNYPNPFNPKSMIRFHVNKTSKVQLKVFDILGRVISILVDEFMQPGKYEVEFDGSKLVSGIYFYQIITDSFVDTKKMVLIK